MPEGIALRPLHPFAPEGVRAHPGGDRATGQTGVANVPRELPLWDLKGKQDCVGRVIHGQEKSLER